MLKRMLWFILLIAAVACVTPILIQVSRRQLYINETENVRQLLQQMRLRRPVDVPEQQWNRAVEWAEIVTSNVACVDYFFPLEDLKPFRVELEQKMKGPVNLNTIDWIWTHLKSGNSGGAKYAATWEAKYRLEVHGEPIPKSSPIYYRGPAFHRPPSDRLCSVRLARGHPLLGIRRSCRVAQPLMAVLGFTPYLNANWSPPSLTRRVAVLGELGEVKALRNHSCTACCSHRARAMR